MEFDTKRKNILTALQAKAVADKEMFLKQEKSVGLARPVIPFRATAKTLAIAARQATSSSSSSQLGEKRKKPEPTPHAGETWTNFKNKTGNGGIKEWKTITKRRRISSLAPRRIPHSALFKVWHDDEESLNKITTRFKSPNCTSHPRLGKCVIAKDRNEADVLVCDTSTIQDWQHQVNFSISGLHCKLFGKTLMSSEGLVQKGEASKAQKVVFGKLKEKQVVLLSRTIKQDTAFVNYITACSNLAAKAPLVKVDGVAEFMQAWKNNAKLQQPYKLSVLCTPAEETQMANYLSKQIASIKLSQGFQNKLDAGFIQKPSVQTTEGFIKSLGTKLTLG